MRGSRGAKISKALTADLCRHAGMILAMLELMQRTDVGDPESRMRAYDQGWSEPGRL